MAETVYPGHIDKLEIGISAVQNEDIHVVLMNWEENHDVRPRLYANIKNPDDWSQPHSWVVGSFSCLSNAHTAIYATDVQVAGGSQYAMVPNGDSNKIAFFQVSYRDKDKIVKTTRFYNGLIYRYTKELLNYDDSVWVYFFVAGYAVDA